MGDRHGVDLKVSIIQSSDEQLIGLSLLYRKLHLHEKVTIYLQAMEFYFRDRLFDHRNSIHAAFSITFLSHVALQWRI